MRILILGGSGSAPTANDSMYLPDFPIRDPTLTDLVAQLTAALAPAYRLERELGGGGMSRVFVAEDTALGRRVVVKVLPPEMAAEVASDRFTREVRVAASLQHPHLVPVLSAGAAGSVIYYVMPLIEGESLAARMAREGALPVEDVVRILRDVTDALAYAHAHGVVHRDIKPANILLSGRHAMVTDFGVAKALTDAADVGGALTGTGLALGTPAYMAPEQAAADRQLDHRADIYALGVVAYEMLAGRPPFSAPTPQAMLAAHVALTPEPVDRYRSGIPPVLSALVMRALEKHPADRWRDADAIVDQLDALRGSTPASTAAVPARPPAPLQPARRRLPVLAVFLAVAVLVTAGAFAISRAAGLPDWVWLATLGAMVAGLPIILYTIRLEHGRAEARITGSHRVSHDAGHRRWFTWRRATLGGAAALGLVALLSGGYMLSRALGIGPGATLLSRGSLSRADRLILADFENRTSDSSIAGAVTEALRVDLGQSRVARLLDRREVAGGLERMGVRRDTILGEQLARDLARREGAKAVIAGEITRLGASYVLTARIVSADSGATLAPVRVTADDDRHLIAAVNRLSSSLRERIGESLRSIRQTEPLEQVTTASLPALRVYSDGVRVFDTGDLPAARRLLVRAVELDTGFAMAWRKLAAVYFNLGFSLRLAREASAHAFAHRDRLPPLERYLTEGSYYASQPGADARRQTLDAFRQALDVSPENGAARNNLVLGLNRVGRFAEAESVARAWSGPPAATMVDNLADALIAQGDWAQLDSILAKAAHDFPPRQPGIVNTRVNAAMAERRFARADTIVKSVEGPAGPPPYAIGWRTALEEVRGHYGRAAKLRANQADSAAAEGDRLSAAANAIVPAYHDLGRGQPARARQALTAVLAGPAFRGLNPADMPYEDMVPIVAALGDAAEVRRLHAAVAGARESGVWQLTGPTIWAAFEAQSERRWRAAAEKFSQSARTRPCYPCSAFYAAQMWDAADVPDSAIAYYELGIGRRGMYFNDLEDRLLYPVALRRLGDLYDAKGDRKTALDYYQRFTDLWRTADADLQPVVKDVQEKMSRLTAE